MNVDDHALDYLAQAHWHHFRYRYGEMVGLDRAKREVCLAATYDEEGRLRSRRARSFHYDTLVMAVGSTQQRFRHAGRASSSRSRWTPSTRRNASTAVWSTPASGRTPNPSRCARASFTSRSSGRAPPGPSWRPSFTGPPGRWRPSAWTGSTPKRTSDHPDRGGAPHPAGAAGAYFRGDRRPADRARRRRPGRSQGHRGPRRTACSWPMAASSRPSWWSGPPASRGRMSCRDLDGLEVTRNNQLVVTPTLQTTRDPDIFAMGDCASCPREGTTARCRRAPRRPISRRPIC